MLVGEEGFEPSQPCGYTALNRARPVQVVGEKGLEPLRPHDHTALNRARLPSFATRPPTIRVASTKFRHSPTDYIRQNYSITICL